MGFAKELQAKFPWAVDVMDHYQEFVCPGCFTDPHLKEFVRDHAVERTCDFCGARGRKLLAARLTEVTEFMEERILRHYDRAVDNLPYDGGEGGYQGTTWDTWDLLTDEVELELSAKARKTLFPAIVEMLGEQEWCYRNPGELPADKEMLFDWRGFCLHVKHNRRFFLPKDRSPEDDEGERRSGPVDVLHQIVDICGYFGLFKDLPAGTHLFRVRPNKGRAPWVAPKDIGPPPPDKAKQNRMTGAGVVAFYGALGPRTALAEAFEGPGYYTLGAFQTLRSVLILDLTSIPVPPSLFADDFTGYYELPFLREFARLVSVPIERNDKVHIEYIPTQVVTEFLREVVEIKGRRVEGIVYRSSLLGGRNVVLFATAEDVEGVPPESFIPRTPWLRLLAARTRKVAGLDQLRRRRVHVPRA